MTRTRIALVVVGLVVLMLGVGGWYLLAPRHGVWLDAAAKRWNVYHRTGFRIGGRGARATFKGESPHWESATPFQAAVERMLRETVTEEASEFGSLVTREEVIETLKEPRATAEYEGSVGMTVALDTPGLISVLIGVSQYTGGAHGNRWFNGRSFAWRDCGAELIGLGDLIDESDTEAMRRLRLMVFRDLKSQGASGMQTTDPGDAGDPPLEPQTLNVFTLHPEGLRFHFAPYSVGSYAEGDSHVTLPWSAVRPLLRADSPVTRWLDERGE